MKGRKPVPGAIHELRGTYKPHRHGPRDAEIPSSGDIGEPPDYLTALEAECWQEFVRISIPGVLLASDRVVLEIACRLWAEMRAAVEPINAARLARFTSCLAALGMTPVDRAKIAVAGVVPLENPWAELKLISGGKEAEESGDE